MAEFHDVILSHTIESGHPDKCGRIVCLQGEDPSVKIGQDWTTLAMEVSGRQHNEENIDTESYELVNVDMEGGIVPGCGSPARNTSED